MPLHVFKMPPMKRKSLTRLALLFASGVCAKLFFFPSSSSSNPSSPPPPTYHEIKEHGMLERVSGADKTLNVHKHQFLQVRMGRDERPDIFDEYIDSGITDYWDRFQVPL